VKEKRESWYAFSRGEDCCERKRACDVEWMRKRKGKKRPGKGAEMKSMSMSSWHWVVQGLNETI
jgi:hypothetical protein